MSHLGRVLLPSLPRQGRERGSANSGLETEGTAVHVQHMGTVGEPVNQGSHHGGVLKELRPSGEGQVRGHNGAALLRPVRDHLE